MLSIHDIGGGSVTILKQVKDIDDRVPMNPSIVQFNGQLLMFYRLINGGVDDNDLYTLYADYSSLIGCVQLNPYTFKPMGESWVISVPEIEGHSDRIEDVRPFVRNGRLYLVGALLLMKEDLSWFDNVSIQLTLSDDIREVTDYLILPKRWDGSREKNWCPPIIPAKFDYWVDPSRSIFDGAFTERHGLFKQVELIHGGTQAVPITIGSDICYLMLGHRQILIDEDMQSMRYWKQANGDVTAYYTLLYLHYALILDEYGLVVNIGRPFYFDRIGVEFAAGIIDDADNYYVSYGSMDRECKIATLPKWRFLDFSFGYTGLDWKPGDATNLG